MFADSRRNSFYGLLIGALLPGASLTGQHFELGIIAPETITKNSVFEIQFTITSSQIPMASVGAQGWALGISHRGLTLISATTEGTVVDNLLGTGSTVTQMTISSPDLPKNDGFVSAVALEGGNLGFLPTTGTVTVARATYRVNATAC